MDGFSAVSLAGNVAQFLEYGIRIIKTTREIATSKQGVSGEVAELEAILGDVKKNMDSIKHPGEFDDGDDLNEETLRNLVQSCVDLCPQITRITERLQLKENGGPRPVQALRILRTAARTMYEKGEMDQLSERLFSLRSQISAHLIVLIEHQQRKLRLTLSRFSSTTDDYQQKFSRDLDLSLKYLEKISKGLDSKAVHRTSITVHAHSDQVKQESEEKNAFSIYRNTVEHFYRNDLGRLRLDKEHAILESLSFGQLCDRESAIPEAHRRTFEWMLAKNAKHKFYPWLRQDEGTFWVSGKAGSGKSTLMRFITEHSTTRYALTEWANANLIIARHFFWRPGTPLQKSQEGLFRSLLFQVLRQKKDLIPVVCGERWLGPRSDSLLPWSRSQLVKAMGALKSILGTTSTSAKDDFKLCLFIDGLDEFDGDHFELIKILGDFTGPARVKMCVSSRPWIEFLDAFGGGPWKIEVQDLTREDMLIYVRDHLGADGRFARLRANNADSASDLITNVVNRAEGVFLWVYLVVRSLLRGLRNEDELRDLKRRMEALPQDLETYFSRMLEEIEDLYRQRTARLFLSLSITRTSLPMITFFFLDFDDESAEVRPAIVASLAEWPNVDQTYLEALTTKKRQLIAQCKDIIHVTPDQHAPLLFGEKVGFLHRTVFDFINTEATYHHLQNLAGLSFVPRKPLFKANLGQVKAMIHLYPRTYIKPHLHNWILGAIFYAYEMEVTSAVSCDNEINEGLDKLDEIMTKQFAAWDFRHAADTLLARDDFVSFFNLAAVCDLSSYVKYKRPNLTPDDLDVLAPGWRIPARVEQVGGFAIVPQTSEGYWRLGNELGVPFSSVSSDDPDGSPPWKLEDMNSQPAVRRIQDGVGPGEALPRAMSQGPEGVQRNTGSKRMHWSFRKLMTGWQRSKVSATQNH